MNSEKEIANGSPGKVAQVNFVSRLSKSATWKWLYVGLGIKRWLLLLVIGVLVLGLGGAYIVGSFFDETQMTDGLRNLTLLVVGHPLRGALLGIVGVLMVAVALYKLTNSLNSALGERSNLAEILYRQRVRKQGLKIVTIGGGTGLSTLLRGLKEQTDHLTAIVTVADDGGSSGRLRRDLGVLPPGDFRQCIAALADSEPLMTSLFQYRFGEGQGLEGHSFGNLFIAAMAGVTGNFERALLESSRVLAVRGQILPSTLQNVTLCAETRNAEPPDNRLERVAGESAITHRGKPIERVYLEPEHVPAYPGVVRAILDADLIIAGPGSLYTSVLPNLLVEELRHALASSKARKVYVCNVATQPGETDDFSVEDHFEALVQHVGKGIFSTVIANNNFSFGLPEHSNSTIVRPRAGEHPDFEMMLTDLVDESMPWRHDSHKLAKQIFKWYNENKSQ